MSKIKGSLFIPWVKVVRADKEGLLLALNETDRKIVQTTVFPSGWYPFETYRNIVELASRRYAKTNEKIIYDWGFNSAKDIASKIYNHIIVDGAPGKTVMSFATSRPSLFDFGAMDATLINDTTAHLAISGFPDDFIPIYHLIHGWSTRLCVLSSAKNIESSFIKKIWTGDSETVIEYTWS